MEHQHSSQQTDTHATTNNHNNSQHQRFQHAKTQCLQKILHHDKSSAGRIDPRAVPICNLFNNDTCQQYYTTSSCSGRCFLYRGVGAKNQNLLFEEQDEKEGKIGHVQTRRRRKRMFERFRVNHEFVSDATRYFNLNTLPPPGKPYSKETQDSFDWTGGGDPLTEPLTTKSEELSKKEPQQQQQQQQQAPTLENDEKVEYDESTWLRFEPFILHVCCYSVSAARTLMDVVRPTFKNVGLTSWNHTTNSINTKNVVKPPPKYMVAIWGDEGLDLPLTTPSGRELYLEEDKEWLKELVNERHGKNWAKLSRLEKDVKKYLTNLERQEIDDSEDECEEHFHEGEEQDLVLSQKKKKVRGYDVIGDVAIFHPTSNHEKGNSEENEEYWKKVCLHVMTKNKSIKICMLRTQSLQGYHRAPDPTLSSDHNSKISLDEATSGMVQLAGPPRDPLLTTHVEYGIKCVVNLRQAFFSPRMNLERQRLCQLVNDAAKGKGNEGETSGENVLVLFSGVGMEALQLAGRTNVKSIVAVEKNEEAVRCALRGWRMLQRNPTAVGWVKKPKKPRNKMEQVDEAEEETQGQGKEDEEEKEEERLRFILGDVCHIVPTLPGNCFHRVIAPRPREGKLDGDLATVEVDNHKNNNGDDTYCPVPTNDVNGKPGGAQYLDILLPTMKRQGGICHWYDFCSLDEWKEGCVRSKQLIVEAVDRYNLVSEEKTKVEFINVVKAGSGTVARRQYRVCVDFQLQLLNETH